MAYRLLPVSDLPNVDFPTIQVSASLPGRQPGDDGLRGGHAARAPVHHHRRHRLDDVDERPGGDPDHHPVHARPRHRRGRPGRAGGHRQGRPAPAARHADAAHVSEGQPRRSARDLPGAQLAHACRSTRWTSTRRRTSPSASRPSAAWRRSPCSARRSTRCACRSTPGPLAARGIGIDEVERAIAGANVNKPTGTLYGPHQAVNVQATGQLLDAAAYRPLIVAYRNGAPVRLQEIGRRHRRRGDGQGRELVQRRARRRAGRAAPAGDEHHRGRRPRSRAAAHVPAAAARRREPQRRLRPLRGHPGIRARRAVHAAPHRRPRRAW